MSYAAARAGSHSPDSSLWRALLAAGCVVSVAWGVLIAGAGCSGTIANGNTDSSIGNGVGDASGGASGDSTVLFDLGPLPPDLVTWDMAGGGCGDSVLDGKETDVDCGGVDCSPCDKGKSCDVGTDCISGMCASGHCTRVVQINFRGAMVSNAGNGPTAVVAGDIDGDGNSDLAITAGTDSSVWFLLGDGKGGMMAATPLLVNGAPNLLALADFNGDKHTDLALVNQSPSAVVYQATGVGVAWSLGATHGVNLSPFGVLPIDVTGDGKLDLLFPCYGDRSPFGGTALTNLTVLRGMGDGTFGLIENIPGVNGPTAVASGDFDGDGKDDLVVANSGDSSVGVMLNKGPFTYTPAATTKAGNFATGLAVADFNRDKHLDVAVMDQTNVTILLGRGDGTFTLGNVIKAGSGTRAIATADFDGDGNPDYVTASSGALFAPDNAVRFFTGDGKGGFFQKLTLVGGMGPVGLAVADFNKDGQPDLAVVNQASNNVDVYLNTSN